MNLKHCSLTFCFAFAILLALANPGSAFTVSTHKEITVDALGEFIRYSIMHDILDEHRWQDSFPRDGTDFRHFDDCALSEGASYINGKYSDAVDALSPDTLGFWDSLDDFGRLLHPAQDLYSHSNWVELGFPRGDIAAEELIDFAQFPSAANPSNRWEVKTSGEAIRGDIIAGDANWIVGPDAVVAVGNGPANSKVPVLSEADGNRIGRVLATGKGTLDGGCMIRNAPFSPSAGTTGVVFPGFDHNDKDGSGSGLHKDDLERRGHLEARALATHQTATEWCRLIARAGRASVDGLLAALWVKPGSSPHPAGTSCAPEPDGPRTITIRVDQVLIKDDNDEGSNPGEIQIAVALYNDPGKFTRHVQTQSNPVEVSSGSLIPSPFLPDELTLCASDDDLVTLAIHGWDNDNPAGSPHSSELDELGDPDNILRGFQVRLEDTLPAGQQVAESDELEIMYHFVSSVPGCAPTPGGVQQAVSGNGGPRRTTRSSLQTRQEAID